MGVIWGQLGTSDDLKREIVPAVYAAQLVELAERFRVKPKVLLADTGVTEAHIESADARITPYALALLASRAIQLTKEPGLGYYFGLHLKLSSHGAVGLAAMTAPTLRGAIDIATRFVGLRTPHLSLKHYVENDLGVLELVDVLPHGALRVFATEALCTAFSQIARSLLGRNVTGFVDMAFPEPAYFQGFAHLLPGAVRFNQEKNRILFPRGMLDESLQMSDPVAARQALSQCEAELARLGEASSLLAELRHELRDAGDSLPTLEEVAERRGVSTRTLKRQLAVHETSFRRLVDEVRRDRALALLERPELTVERIAELLGYSDASNFQRAFRRWLGVTPAGFRAAHVAKKS